LGTRYEHWIDGRAALRACNTIETIGIGPIRD
jgi:hypothetical protein